MCKDQKLTIKVSIHLKRAAVKLNLKNIASLALGCCLFSNVFTVFAQGSVLSERVKQPNILEVAYKTFYSHTRKISSEDITALRFAFGFTNIHAPDKLCQINQARIDTQKVTIDLLVTSEQRFSIPTEKALKLADAMVVLDIEQPANHCDINVQIETLPEYLVTQYSVDDLRFIQSQYVAFFDEMGGFMSFLMPQVSGLQMRFADETLNYPLNNGLAIVQGILRISSQQLKEVKTIVLPEAPLRITALTSSK